MGNGLEIDSILLPLIPLKAKHAAPFAGPVSASFRYIKVLSRQLAIIFPQYKDLEPPPITEIDSHKPPAFF